MLGAIIGDIVGSVYEWHNIKTKDFPFFRDDCFFTDDTVMTIAVAEGLMNGGGPDDFIDAMKKYGRMYPNAGYGGRFGRWLMSDDREPYNSWGNGSAMRVSPVGFFVKPDWEYDDSDNLAERCATITHNHPEGIKGAQATAAAIRFMRAAKPKEWNIKAYQDRLRPLLEDRYGYNLRRSLDEIRPSYRFNESCQETVPQAIIAFLESTSFEDAIRNAISLGGDSDTLAAITGGIAEAAYGIPDWIRDKALSYLDKPLLDVYFRWQDYISKFEMVDKNKIYVYRWPEQEKPIDIAMDADPNYHGFKGLCFLTPPDHPHMIRGELGKRTETGFTFISEGFAPGEWEFYELTYEYFKEEFYQHVTDGKRIIEEVGSTEELRRLYHDRF